MTTPETRHERDLKAFGGPAGLAAVEAYVAQIADTAPPLTSEQRAKLRILLRHGPAAESTAPASSVSTAA